MKFLALAAAASALRLTACDCTVADRSTLTAACKTECGFNAQSCCENGVKKTTAACQAWTGSCSAFAADKATCCNGSSLKANAPEECKGFAC